MQTSTERRRSARVSEPQPLVIRGSDLLGQPFEERVSTLNFNLHGCRYSSKHHLPKNTWLTIELPKNSAHRNVRARVAWIQRPHSVREFFQIAVELESPENIWGLDAPPVDWASNPLTRQPAAEEAVAGRKELRSSRETDAGAVPTTLASYMGKLMADNRDSSFETSESDTGLGPQFTPAADSPFLRDLRAELDRHAARAVETATAQAQEKLEQSATQLEQRREADGQALLRKWIDEFAKAQKEAREHYTREMAARQEEVRKQLTNEYEEITRRARSLMEDFDSRLNALREEVAGAQETISRMAQSRLLAEGAEAERTTKALSETSQEHSRAAESEIGAWRDRLQAEMNHAQLQWNELLQSSLDSNLQRLVEQLSERSQEVQQSAEQRLTGRFGELIQPVTQAAAKAGETLSEIRTGLDQQVAEARGSLDDVERTAARMRENSAQFEAASHDSLNELHRRLENMLEAQTTEMGRRIEALVSGMSQRISPAIEAMGDQQVARAAAQMEAKLAPHLERVPALLRELAAREVQVEEGLRLHRERLRQASENNQRDVSSRMVFTLAELHKDFESARTQALAKWNEELDASGVRASHSAAEALSRTSEWFQQEARSRLQVLVEQALASASTSLDERLAGAFERFESQLDDRGGQRMERLSQDLVKIGEDITVRTMTQIESAAAAAAGSFGEVLHRISNEEVEFFGQRSRTAAQERSEEFERTSRELLQNLDNNARASVEQFNNQMGSHVESRIADGRSALAAEFGAAMEGHRAERNTHELQWVARLNELLGEAERKYQERLENASDTWSVSSVRRLNEHGQNVIESLMRSADQALRSSFSKMFDGLSEMIRDRAPVNTAETPGAAVPPNREPNEASRSSNA
jgi:hypothetical protein